VEVVSYSPDTDKFPLIKFNVYKTLSSNQLVSLAGLSSIYFSNFNEIPDFTVFLFLFKILMSYQK
jgi:hypothetical protein